MLNYRSAVSLGTSLLCAVVALPLAGCGVARPPALPLIASVEARKPEAPRRDGRIRIGLRRLSGGPRLEVKPTAAGWIKDATTGRSLRRLAAGKAVRLTADYASGQVLVEGPGLRVLQPEVVLTGGMLRAGRGRYPGALRVKLAGTGLFLVNELEIEQYLAGVLPGEIPAYFGMEAQKALAVAARTYALVQWGKHGEYDLCDGTCCQMYLGHRAGGRGLAAVRATRHQCLWSGNELAYAFYSAHCGGVSTRIEDVPLRDKPDRPLPYLRVVRDAPAGGRGYCAHSPYQQWVKRLSRQELEARLNEEPETEVGKLLGVRFTELDSSGRVLSVLLRGTPAGPQSLLSAATLAPPPVEKVVTGWQFRNAVGALTLKSTLVQVGQTGPDTFRFIGRGFGHGLGLCQIGADGMARARKSYRQILAHYYPGTRLGKLGS